jgi:hypothetical protein
MIHVLGTVGLAIYFGGIYGVLCTRSRKVFLVSVLLIVLGFGSFLGALWGVTI